jgi:hypothetical protein
MGGQLFGFAVVAGVLLFTAWLMRVMWGQMRRVNAHTAERSRERVVAEPEPVEPAYEELDPATGQYRVHRDEANEGLIRQGARARSSGWYLEP